MNVCRSYCVAPDPQVRFLVIAGFMYLQRDRGPGSTGLTWHHVLTMQLHTGHALEELKGDECFKKSNKCKKVKVNITSWGGTFEVMGERKEEKIYRFCSTHFLSIV